VLALLAAMFSTVVVASAASLKHQNLVTVGNSADYNGVRSKAQVTGATIVRDLRQIGRLVVWAPGSQSEAIDADSRVTSVALDHVSSLGPPESTPTSPA